jgi:SAM-dependent methyltransferase
MEGKEIAGLQGQVERLRQEVTASEEKRRDLASRLGRLQEEQDKARREIERLHHEVAARQELIEGMESTRTWRLRRALRSLRERCRSLQVRPADKRGFRGTDIPLPPQSFIDTIGGGDFEGIGNGIFGLLREQCRVQPTDSILDIGSGCGRIAIPFTRFLTSGTYCGFDVIQPMVEWCRENISSRHPNFHFQHADLSNTFYNPAGREDASGFAFPYADATFDIVFAASIFTHLLPNSARRYAAETARVLRKRGRALLTFFVLDDEFRRRQAAGTAYLPFPHGYDHYAVMDENQPEAVVAYEESYAKELLKDAGLNVEKLSYGFWRASDEGPFQDWILVSR